MVLNYYDLPNEEDASSGSQRGAVASPTFFSEFPTTSSDVSRPRTVAAEYNITDVEARIGTLTVMFRDGDLWNYYGVPEGMWQAFHGALSKGKSFLNSGAPLSLDNWPNQGPADESNIDIEGGREAFEVQARLAQLQAATRYRYKNNRGRAQRVSKSRLRSAGIATPKSVFGSNPAPSSGKIHKGKNTSSAGRSRKR